MVRIGRGWWRLPAVGIVAGMFLMLGAAPAFAHTRLVSSNPADGAPVTAAPSAVTLTFNDEMKAEFSTITVLGPDGAAWQTGAVTSTGTSVTTQVRPLGPAGRYDVGYRVVSGDGHPVTGKLTFMLTSPGPGATTSAAAPAAPTAAAAPVTSAPPAVVPAASTTGTGGAPLWPWLVGGIVVIAGGVFAALRMSRN